MTPEDIIWLLKNLPLDLVQYIIANYNPQCFFIMDTQWLLEYDWAKQCKVTWGLSGGSLYSYYMMSQRTIDIQIIAGLYYTFLRKADGTLMCCGRNSHGQLGLGDTRTRTKFEEVKKVRLLNGDIVELRKEDIAQVAVGLRHTVLLTYDGTLFGCGDNTQEQLGVGDTKIFEEIRAPKNIVQIACGHWHTLILTADGTLMGRGYNGNSQLGLDNEGIINKFTVIDVPKDIVKIVCGNIYTMIIRANGTLMVCGYNYYGQLGLGDYRTSRKKFTETDTPKNIVHIALSPYHTILLGSNGKFLSCGGNDFGQLGLNGTKYASRTKYEQNDKISKVVQVACGYYHSIFLLAHGKLMGCGSNNQGQLAGMGGSDVVGRLKKIDKVTHIACSYYHTFVVADNILMACGKNDNGQLGVGDTYDTENFKKVMRI